MLLVCELELILFITFGLLYSIVSGYWIGLFALLLGSNYEDHWDIYASFILTLLFYFELV